MEHLRTLDICQQKEDRKHTCCVCLECCNITIALFRVKKNKEMMVYSNYREDNKVSTMRRHWQVRAFNVSGCLLLQYTAMLLVKRKCPAPSPGESSYGKCTAVQHRHFGDSDKQVCNDKYNNLERDN